MGDLILEGDVVRLEPPTMGHASGLGAAASADRGSYAFAWVPDGPEAMEEYVRVALEECAAGLSLPFATVRRSDGVVVGSTRFADIQRWRWPPGSPLARSDGAPDSVEIGYTWVAGAGQRTAINTEAKYLMLRHSFEKWRVHRVYLKTDERLARSRAAIERLGATLDGVLRAHQRAADGGVCNTAWYSILPDQWPSIRDRLESRLSGARP